MKKIMTILAAGLVACACASAGDFVNVYNPPFGGQDIYKLSNPTMMSGAASASGGPVFSVLPMSITYNPALPSVVQRDVINLSYTAFLDTNRADESDPVFGQMFQGGAIVPTRYFVFAGTVQAAFANFPRMDLGNTILVHAGLSKDVTDSLFVGMNLYTGFYMGDGSDFTVGLDFGVLYKMKQVGFLQNPRLGISLTNLGKPVTGNYHANGINGTSNFINYPGIVTPRASFAATLFDVQKFNGSFSADVYAPEFMDLAFDLGLAFAYSDIVQLCFAWEGDVREFIKGAKPNWPTVGLNIRLTINSKKIAKGNEDWEKSEIVPSVAWKNCYDGIQAFSGGLSLYLGMKDTKAPEIYLWDESGMFDEEETVGAPDLFEIVEDAVDSAASNVSERMGE